MEIDMFTIGIIDVQSILNLLFNCKGISNNEFGLLSMWQTDSVDI